MKKKESDEQREFTFSDNFEEYHSTWPKEQ